MLRKSKQITFKKTPKIMGIGGKMHYLQSITWTKNFQKFIFYVIER
jgi:hypothetical protein